MSNQFNSPTQLNTFTSAQGRVLKKGALNKRMRELFVKNFYVTTIHKREKQHEKDKIEAGELLRQIAIESTGLSVEFFDALPKGLFENISGRHGYFILPEKYIKDPEVAAFVRRKCTLKAVIPNDKTIPHSVYSFVCQYGGEPRKDLPTITPSLEAATERLIELINKIAVYHYDARKLHDMVTDSVEGCRTVKQLCELYVSAEDYFDGSFYAQTPGVPGTVILPKELRQALSKWAA